MRCLGSVHRSSEVEQLALGRLCDTRENLDAIRAKVTVAGVYPQLARNRAGKIVSQDDARHTQHVR
jgi:hypothetical protein